MEENLKRAPADPAPQLSQPLTKFDQKEGNPAEEQMPDHLRHPQREPG